MIHEEQLDMENGNESESDDQEHSFREEMKGALAQGITELLDETETSAGHIAQQAFEHIHSK